MDTPRKTLEELRRVFTGIAGKDKQIDSAEFKKALGLKDEYFAARMFSLFDTDKSGTIDIEEFLRAVEELVLASAEEKLKFAYALHDINGDNCIDKEEIFRLIVASLKENNLDFPPEQVTALVDILFLEADTDKSGKISFEEFKGLIEKHPDLLEAMAVSPVSWLKPRNREVYTSFARTEDQIAKGAHQALHSKQLGQDRFFGSLCGSQPVYFLWGV